ncbi:MAG: hypothetical protein JKY04_07310, partial [Sneathiella sp.]|nr:hypothetical protein [Sneathiella sp.]
PPSLIPMLMKVPDVVFRILANKMLAVDPNVRTSMWWDLSNGKHTEIEFINGAILGEARLLGVACPANEAMVRLIREVERGERSQGMSSAELWRECSG